MAKQFSTTFRNNAVAQFETTVGTAPLLRIYDLTAGAPANCAASITATLLCEITLPSDWLSAASSGSVSKSGTWAGTGAAAGTADFYRIYASDGTTCHEQGTVTATGGGGDLTLDNTSIASSQPVTITTWTLAAGGA